MCHHGNHCIFVNETRDDMMIVSKGATNTIMSLFATNETFLEPKTKPWKVFVPIKVQRPKSQGIVENLTPNL